MQQVKKQEYFEKCKNLDVSKISENFFSQRLNHIISEIEDLPSNLLYDFFRQPNPNLKCQN